MMKRLFAFVAIGLGLVGGLCKAADDPSAPFADIQMADATQHAGLERLERLLADNQLDEAVETIRRVMDSDGGRLLPLSGTMERGAGFDRWVPVRAACQARMAAWAETHPAALELYRQRVEPLADRWYRQAIDGREPAMLARLTEQLLLSRRGDKALLALGDWALERGDYVMARGAWQQISPQLRSSGPPAGHLRLLDGGPWWLSLPENWNDDGDTWRALLTRTVESPSWLAYPDSDLNLADVRARLVLASILEQSWSRVDRELASFKLLHPEAGGRLAGRAGLWLDLLTTFAQQTRQQGVDTSGAGSATAARGSWPTLGGNSQRNGQVRRGLDLEGRASWSWPPGPNAGPPGSAAASPVSWPVVCDGVGVFVSGSRLMALDVETGRPAFPLPAEPPGAAAIDSGSGQRVPGELYRIELPGGDPPDEAAILGRLPGWTSAYGAHVFAVLGGGSIRRGGRAAAETLPELLLGVDLAQEGKVCLRVTLDGPAWNADWRFLGSPLADEGSVYVCLERADGVRGETHVAAFDAQSGRLRWRQWLAGTDLGPRAESIVVGWLTQGHQRLYCQTNRGVIACLDALDGRVYWLTRYRRVLDDDVESNVSRRRRGGPPANPLVLDGDQLFAAPVDSDRIFSLDANTGQVLWATDGQRGADVRTLLGVARGQLVGAGERLYWFDACRGAMRGEFPLGPSTVDAGHVRAGPRGVGGGLLVGDTVWWPTRDEILVFSQETERTSDGWRPQAVARIDLRARGARGGDLAIVGNVLMVHTPSTLQAIRGAYRDVSPLPLLEPSATLGSLNQSP